MSVGEKIKMTNDLIDKFAQYIDEIDGIYKVDKNIKESLEAFRTTEKKLAERASIDQKSISDEKSRLKLNLQIYYLLCEYDKFANLYINFMETNNINEDNVLMSSDISTQNLLTFKKSYNSLFQVIDTYTKSIKSVNESILHLLSSQMVDTISKNEEYVDMFNEFYEKNPSIVDLFSLVVYDLFSLTLTKPTVKKLQTYVENAKTRALTEDANQPTSKGCQNPLFRSFGLVPKTNYIPFQELTGCKNPKEFAKGRNVVILYKIIKQPIIFDYFKLENKKIRFERDGAINNDLIKQHENIYTTEYKNSSWDLSSFDFYPNKETDVFTVLETNDNKNYRFLTPWTALNSNEAPKYYYLGILRFLGVEKIPEANQDRISAYHESQMDTEKMFFKYKSANIEYIEENIKSTVDAASLRHDIAHRLRTKYGTDEKLEAKLNDPQFSEFYDALIIELYPKYIDIFSKTYGRSETREMFPPSESLITFLSSINSQRQIFIKDLKSGFGKGLTLEDVLKEKISNHENFYKTVLLKTELLKTQLMTKDYDKSQFI